MVYILLTFAFSVCFLCACGQTEGKQDDSTESSQDSGIELPDVEL